MLGTLALRCSHQTGGNVSNPDGGFDFIDVLAAWAGGAVEVFFEFGFGDWWEG